MARRKKAAAPAGRPVEPMASVPEVAAELQRLQRMRSVVIKSRVMQANRLRAVVAGSLGYYAAMPEAERRKKFAEAEAVIKAVRAGEAGHPMAPVIATTLVGLDAFDRCQAGYESEMRALARRLPAHAWVGHPDRRGFGTLFLAIVVGECGDLANYPNPAKLWRRMGCAPWAYDGKTLMGATWRGGREGRLPADEWESYGYSPRRRSIAYLIGEGIVKQNFAEPGAGEKGERLIGTETASARPGPYRARYEEAKARAKEAHPDWPDLRCHRHGMLLATKRLLRDLWVEWNRPGERPPEAGAHGAGPQKRAG